MTDNELDKESFLQQVHCINTWVFSFFERYTYKNVCIFVQEFQEFFKAPEAAFETPIQENKMCTNIIAVIAVLLQVVFSKSAIWKWSIQWQF